MRDGPARGFQGKKSGRLPPNRIRPKEHCLRPETCILDLLAETECSSYLAMPGNGPQAHIWRTQDLSPLPAQSASTTGSLCATSLCFAADRASRLRATFERPIVISFPRT